MASQMNEIQNLVQQLETHLNHNEVRVRATIKVTPQASDAQLDDLFLAETFSKHHLIDQISIIRPQTQNELEVLETSCLDQANKRLKQYIDQLNEHIIKIVESESDEFLAVAGKLEGFKNILGDLKDSVKDFHQMFAREKNQTTQIFTYMSQQYLELEGIIREKEQLEQLMRLQESYTLLDQKVQQLSDEDYIDLEECTRILADLKKNFHQSQDQTFTHNLTLLERKIVAKVQEKFTAFISTTDFFSVQQQDEDVKYFYQCELASYLRNFKLLGQKKYVYEQLSSMVIKQQLNILIKKAYDAKGNAINLMKGEGSLRLPFEIFTQGLIKEIFKGSLLGVFEITLLQADNYNYVEGYSIIEECLWPMILLVLDQQLSFVYSSGNLVLFQKNYLIGLKFIETLKQSFTMPTLEQDLISRFNLQTYLNVLIIENTDRYSQDIEKQFDQTNDQLKPLHHITLQYATRILSDELYLPEVGDKLIKLSTQFVIRHLNYMMDKVNEKKSLATERILFILEDLNTLQVGIKDQLMPLISKRIAEQAQDADPTFIKDKYLQPLIKEHSLRFDYLTEPCIKVISTKVSQRLQENLQAFKQIPPMYRMTNRQLDKQPSQFLENTLKPLQTLSAQKVFSNLTKNIKYKLYENVLNHGLKDLSTLIEDIVNEEKRMHESLKKYKKDDASKNLSDFDKMLVQLYIVQPSYLILQDVSELEEQIKQLFSKEERNFSKFDEHLIKIHEKIASGKTNYEVLYNNSQ